MTYTERLRLITRDYLEGLVEPHDYRIAIAQLQYEEKMVRPLENDPCDIHVNK